MQTLVTGGAGLIGSHLVRQLLQQGREVVVLDDFSRGSMKTLSYLGVNTEYREVDLRNYEDTKRAINGAETLFHLAARVGSLEYLHWSENAELNALISNLTIDSNVLSACLETGVKKLIYASSVSVYPIHTQYQLGVTFSEELLPLGTDPQFLSPSPEFPPPNINPEGGYGWAKLMGELALSWARGLKVGMARIFNVYGEGEDLGETAHVVPALLRKAIRYPKEDFIVWGDGTQTRDFLYASDCIDALIKLEQKVSELNKAAFSPIVINIGSDVPVPISVLAEKIVEISGKEIKIKYDPTKPVGPLSRTADVARAKKLLGWEPRVSLDEGLRYTYRWAEKVLSEVGID